MPALEKLQKTTRGKNPATYAEKIMVISMLNLHSANVG
jgi:hypothetical protein